MDSKLAPRPVGNITFNKTSGKWQLPNPAWKDNDHGKNVNRLIDVGGSTFKNYVKKGVLTPPTAPLPANLHWKKTTPGRTGGVEVHFPAGTIKGFPAGTIKDNLRLKTMRIGERTNKLTTIYKTMEEYGRQGLNFFDNDRLNPPLAQNYESLFQSDTQSILESEHGLRQEYHVQLGGVSQQPNKRPRLVSPPASSAPLVSPPSSRPQSPIQLVSPPSSSRQLGDAPPPQAPDLALSPFQAAEFAADLGGDDFFAGDFGTQDLT